MFHIHGSEATETKNFLRVCVGFIRRFSRYVERGTVIACRDEIAVNVEIRPDRENAKSLPFSTRRNAC